MKKGEPHKCQLTCSLLHGARASRCTAPVPCAATRRAAPHRAAPHRAAPRAARRAPPAALLPCCPAASRAQGLAPLAPSNLPSLSPLCPAGRGIITRTNLARAIARALHATLVQSQPAPRAIRRAYLAAQPTHHDTGKPGALPPAHRARLELAGARARAHALFVVKATARGAAARPGGAGELGSSPFPAGRRRVRGAARAQRNEERE